MEIDGKTTITVRAVIHSPIDKVWKMWTTPEDIVKWNYASKDWHSPHVYNDLRVGGIFNYRMEARDGSYGFDFKGIYNKVIINELIEYTIDDSRKVKINFSSLESKTEIVETFEAENVNSFDMQHDGWQAILDNFKQLVENNI
jgi:uncharacterized protein YndB with AHSA1/START domain